MTLIAGAGALFAQADADEPSHAEVVRLLQSERGPIVTSELAVAEADHLVHAELEEDRAIVERYRDLRSGSPMRRSRCWRCGTGPSES